MKFCFRVGAEFGGELGDVARVLSIGRHGRERRYDVQDQKLRVEQTGELDCVRESLEGRLTEVGRKKNSFEFYS
jgi:hypothetical protein